jgi:membrane protease YdiL (CAAX protease family)
VTDWTTFAGFAGVVLALLLLLARASQGIVSGGSEPARSGSRPRPQSSPPPSHRSAEGLPLVSRGAGDGGDRDADGENESRRDVTPPRPTGLEQLRSPEPSTATLLANVALSQALFAGLLLAAVWFTSVPLAALGVGRVTPELLAAGVGLGVALFGANALASLVGERFGIGGGEELRRLLTPETPAGWAALLLVVLPVVAGFEELLFRGVLVGALATGFDLSPWLLAAGSSVAFALGHGAQGRAGVVVTGLLGFVLAAAFVLTGSLLVVVVAHYLVNALEFVVHGALDVEWRRGRARPDRVESGDGRGRDSDSGPEPDRDPGTDPEPDSGPGPGPGD